MAGTSSATIISGTRMRKTEAEKATADLTCRMQYSTWDMTSAKDGLQVAKQKLSTEGLAVPAARNVDDPDVLKGKELFEQIGCTYCHKPSWTTGDYNFYDPNGIFSKGDSRLPKYPNQKIWPYSDMIQHKLYMVNDIRTGWCRTILLWGRGLHQRCTGSPTADRLHGNEKSDAYYIVQKFRELSKEDRDAIVKFIDSI